MLPRALAESDVSLLAGIGRGQPNQNPFLPPPQREGILVLRTGGLVGRRSAAPDAPSKSSYIAARNMFMKPPLREGEVEVQGEAHAGPNTLHGGGGRRSFSLSRVRGLLRRPARTNDA